MKQHNIKQGSIVALAFFLIPFLQNTAVTLLLFAISYLVPKYIRYKYIRPKEMVFLTVLLAALIVYLLLGAEELKPERNDLLAVLLQVVSSFAVIFTLFLVTCDEAKKAIQYLCVGVVTLVFLEGILTFIYHPAVALQRLMIYPITGAVFQSTGQINPMTVATGFLLLQSGRKFVSVIALFLLVSMVLTYANRTGMVLAATYIVISLFQIVKSSRKTYSLIAIACMLISAYLIWQLGLIPKSLNIGISRLFDEGLETERSDLLSTGLEVIFSGDYPLGGAQLYNRANPWYHNIYLDAYRVAGFPALVLFLWLTTISFLAAWSSKSKGLIFVWLVAFSMTISSIPIEGPFIEYTMYFAIFSYAIIVRRPYMYTLHNKFVRQQLIKSNRYKACGMNRLP